MRDVVKRKSVKKPFFLVRVSAGRPSLLFQEIPRQHERKKKWINVSQRSRRSNSCVDPLVSFLS